MVADHANFIDRVQKLKDARTQAMKEIDDYRRAKEQEFKAFEASVRPVLECFPSTTDRFVHDPRGLSLYHPIACRNDSIRADCH